jgi:hypothetical protein
LSFDQLAKQIHSHGIAVRRRFVDDLGHNALQLAIAQAGDVDLDNGPLICHHKSFLL